VGPFRQVTKWRSEHPGHTTLVRMRPEEEARKIAVYAEIWEEAKPLSPRS
jgi:hypothetical protein